MRAADEVRADTRLAWAAEQQALHAHVVELEGEVERARAMASAMSVHTVAAHEQRAGYAQGVSALQETAAALRAELAVMMQRTHEAEERAEATAMDADTRLEAARVMREGLEQRLEAAIARTAEVSRDAQVSAEATAHALQRAGLMETELRVERDNGVARAQAAHDLEGQRLARAMQAEVEAVKRAFGDELARARQELVRYEFERQSDKARCVGGVACCCCCCCYS